MTVCVSDADGVPSAPEQAFLSGLPPDATRAHSHEPRDLRARRISNRYDVCVRTLST